MLHMYFGFDRRFRRKRFLNIRVKYILYIPWDIPHGLQFYKNVNRLSSHFAFFFVRFVHFETFKHFCPIKTHGRPNFTGRAIKEVKAIQRPTFEQNLTGPMPNWFKPSFGVECRLVLKKKFFSYWGPDGHMSRVMRKPAFYICKNKDADQLRDNREVDQRLCFRFLDNTMPLLPKYKVSSLWSSPVAVQPGLCQTWSESKLLVFSSRGTYKSLQPDCPSKLPPPPPPPSN